ncbi:MAG TPA: ParB/RepB/Spo0J family partition protein [Actinomycetota bacterium]|nr:ParB/RepB/Spo0J family partition protein [Actinomycetota bacterium]
MRRGGLGRGLSALIPGAAEEAGLLEIPVGAIGPNPRQPRTMFDEESLESLARSIQEVGVLQPVVVRRTETGYELVAGERRLRAARLAGLATIPAVIRDADDTDSLRDALIENIHRADLGPLELAEAFAELLEDLGVTQETLAERLGVSRPHIANTIRLLQLAPDVQHLLSEGKLTAGHGRALLGLDDSEAQVSLGLRAVAEELSVREVEELVRTYSGVPERVATAAPPRTAAPADNGQFGEAIEILSEQLQTRVSIKMGKRRGKIIVEFSSADDLERIVEEIVGSGKVHIESS